MIKAKHSLVSVTFYYSIDGHNAPLVVETQRGEHVMTMQTGNPKALQGAATFPMKGMSPQACV